MSAEHDNDKVCENVEVVFPTKEGGGGGVGKLKIFNMSPDTCTGEAIPSPAYIYMTDPI